MLTVRIVDLPAGDAHGELALRGWPAIQAWPHDTALRQELSVCNIVACRVSSGRARPSATASGWARACGQAQARARNAGAFVVGPHAARALRARGAWRGGRIRSTKEYQRARRHIAPGKERIANKPKALAFGLGSVQSPHRTLCLPIVCVCMPELSQGPKSCMCPGAHGCVAHARRSSCGAQHARQRALHARAASCRHAARGSYAFCRSRR